MDNYTNIIILACGLLLLMMFIYIVVLMIESSNKKNEIEHLKRELKSLAKQATEAKHRAEGLMELINVLSEDMKKWNFVLD